MQYPAHTISTELQLQHDASGRVLPMQSMLQLYKANFVPKTNNASINKLYYIHYLQSCAPSSSLLYTTCSNYSEILHIRGACHSAGPS
eukprot:14550-Heterococcus_DN1.PRE.1